MKKNHKRSVEDTPLLIPPFFSISSIELSSSKVKKSHIFMHVGQVLHFLKDSSYYRWVTRDTSDSTLDQRNQICHRPAQVVIPWTLPLPFIEIMKSGSL